MSEPNHLRCPGRVARRAAGAAALAAILAFAVAKHLGTVNHWKLTHWLFSYDLGFVKRGLVGTLSTRLAPDGVVTVEAIVTASLAIAALFAAALAALAWPLFARARGLALVAAASACLAPGVGFLLSDLGRFDVLNGAAIAIAIAIARARRSLPYPVFLALAGATVLIHEAALLIAVPVLFVAHLELDGRLDALVAPRRWPALALRAAPVLALAAALALFGRVDLPLRDLLLRLAAHADFRPSPQSAYVLLRGLDSNVAQILGAERALPSARGVPLGSIDWASFGMVLRVALVQLAFAGAAFGTLARRRRAPVRAALLACFAAPFALLLVGVDWGRWVGMASAQLAVATLLFAPGLDGAPSALRRRALALGVLCAVLAAASPYRMEGARGGTAESPRTGIARWLEDARSSDAWQRAFVTP